MVLAAPLPPVVFIEAADAATHQAVLVRIEFGQPLVVDHAAGESGLAGDRTDEIDIAQRIVGEDVIGAGDRAHLDEKHLRQRYGVFVAGEDQLPAGQPRATAVAGEVAVVVLFETPDDAIGLEPGKNEVVAQVDEVGERALLMQQAVESGAGGGLEEIARGDENQLATRVQMPQAFFDEEQIKIGAAVEAFLIEQRAGALVDVLKAHIGRVADDGVEFFAVGVGEEIHHLRAWRGEARVDFERHATGNARIEGAIAAGRIEGTTGPAAQGQHGLDRGRRCEYLAQTRNVVSGS